MSDLPADALLFDVIGHIALVRLNRPLARNAVDPETAQALDAAVRRIEQEPAIRVAILASSTPGMFSAGGDLKAIAAGRSPELRIGDAGFAGFVDAMRLKPWIAAVDGPALGGGCELCLACDMIVASPDSTFGLPEVRLGMIAGAGGIYRIARVLPRNVALRLVATGQPIDGATAAHHGMVSELAPAGQVIEAALRIAAQIAECAPIAVAEALGIARQAPDRSDAELCRLSRERMQIVMESEDAREGPRAFIEKRAPHWQGR
jgi:enoyl-CoA hydratase/carnithine racemase